MGLRAAVTSPLLASTLVAIASLSKGGSEDRLLDVFAGVDSCSCRFNGVPEPGARLGVAEFVEIFRQEDGGPCKPILAFSGPGTSREGSTTGGGSSCLLAGRTATEGTDVTTLAGARCGLIFALFLRDKEARETGVELLWRRTSRAGEDSRDEKVELAVDPGAEMLTGGENIGSCDMAGD